MAKTYRCKPGYKCLFIGGASDGKRIMLPELLPLIKQMVPRCYTTLPIMVTEKPVEIEKSQSEVYRRERLSAGCRVFSVYVLENLSMESALARLIEGYNPL